MKSGLVILVTRIRQQPDELVVMQSVAGLRSRWEHSHQVRAWIKSLWKRVVATELEMGMATA